MNALIGWLGGKSRLADKIISKIPPHTCYVEVFCGGAHVYFTKQPSKGEVGSGNRIIEYSANNR